VLPYSGDAWKTLANNSRIVKVAARGEVRQIDGRQALDLPTKQDEECEK
jgi:hypothetical protein